MTNQASENMVDDSMIEAAYRAFCEVRFGKALSDDEHDSLRSRLEVTWMKPTIAAALRAANMLREPGAPDAATEPKNLSIMNGWLVEMVGKHTCGTGPDGHYGAHEPGCGYEPHLNLADLEGWPEFERDVATEEAFKKAEAFDKAVALSERRQTLLEEAESERDAALAAIAAVRAIHVPITHPQFPGDKVYCHGCAVAERGEKLWPCGTIAALDGGSQ